LSIVGRSDGYRQCQKPTKRLTASEAQAKVIECREMAKLAKNPEHRAMLVHMADTWERIAKSLMTNGG
jgi:hypothetical protein